MSNQEQNRRNWWLAAWSFVFLSFAQPAAAEVNVSVVPLSANFFGGNFSGALLNVGGTLYGTTLGGGNNQGPNFGTVFVSGQSGLATIYQFTGGLDGSEPNSLVNFANTIFGTTRYGGQAGDSAATDGNGTVFSITPSGQKSIVYALERFKGRKPVGLTPAGGSLYLTTASGGRTKHGAVLKVRLSGGARSIYEFQGGASDGAEPSSPLLKYAGTLYGTTFLGGGTGFGDGTIYNISPAGVETVLHKFDPSIDGCCSTGGLLRVGSNFYGVTLTQNSVIYRITSNGQSDVIYRFPVPPFSQIMPNGPLVRLGNRLYGTTAFGGKDGDGTIYQITLMGRYREIYHFPRNGTRGVHPNSGLVNVNGTLYGTTPSTVFYFTPNPADEE